MKMIDHVCTATVEYIDRMPKSKRKKYGQFFTSKETAVFMAGLFSIPEGRTSLSILSVVCLILLQSEQSVIQIFSAVIFLQKMIQCIIILQRHTDHHIIDNLVFTVWIIIHDITLL